MTARHIGTKGNKFLESLDVHDSNHSEHAPVLLHCIPFNLNVAASTYANTFTHFIEPALPVVTVTESLTALPAPLLAATVIV